MPKDYTKEIVNELSKINDNLRRIEKRIADSVVAKQFHELPPPPEGMVYQSVKGLVAMHIKDYEKMKKAYNKERNDSDDEV